MMSCFALQDALLVGTAAGVVMLNSAATALAAAAAATDSSEDDFAAFEGRCVMRARLCSAQNGRETERRLDSG